MYPVGTVWCVFGGTDVSTDCMYVDGTVGTMYSKYSGAMVGWVRPKSTDRRRVCNGFARDDDDGAFRLCSASGWNWRALGIVVDCSFGLRC